MSLLEHLALTVRLLLLVLLPKDDCLLLRSRRETTGVSAAGSSMPAELDLHLPQNCCAFSDLLGLSSRVHMNAAEINAQVNTATT